MRTREVVSVPLVLALIVSLSAVWAGAAPILGDGASVVAGWHLYRVGNDYVGCTSQNGCQPCSGTFWESCTAGPCTAMDYLEIASHGGSGTVEAIGQPVCEGCWGNNLYDASCNL